MNLYLLEMILKFLRMIFVACVSLFNITLYAENETIKENSIVNNNKYAVNRVIIKEDNKNQVSNITNKKAVINKKTTLIENTKNKTTSIQTKKEQKTNKIITSEKIDIPLAEYTGRLTGYGPDCVGCSGKGNLACKTKNKKIHSLVSDGIYYEDSEYGKVRILAAATSKFKCGTIVTVTKPGMEPFIGIVLDTGGSMRKAWANGDVWMDLAYTSNAMAGNDNLTGKNIKFSVQRWGW